MPINLGLPSPDVSGLRPRPRCAWKYILSSDSAPAALCRLECVIGRAARVQLDSGSGGEADGSA
jgi:hypothetical protein